MPFGDVRFAVFTPNDQGDKLRMKIGRAKMQPLGQTRILKSAAVTRMRNRTVPLSFENDALTERTIIMTLGEDLPAKGRPRKRGPRAKRK